MTLPDIVDPALGWRKVTKYCLETLFSILNRYAI